MKQYMMLFLTLASTTCLGTDEIEKRYENSVHTAKSLAKKLYGQDNNFDYLFMVLRWPCVQKAKKIENSQIRKIFFNSEALRVHAYKAYYKCMTQSMQDVTQVFSKKVKNKK